MSCRNVLRVGYDNELAVPKAAQAVGLQVLLGPKVTPGTLDDLLEVGKGRLDILGGVETQSLQKEHIKIQANTLRLHCFVILLKQTTIINVMVSNSDKSVK